MTIKFRAFPSIGQYANIVKQVRDSAKWNNVPVPTLTFTGSVKLHGCVHKDSLITLANGSHEKISDIESGTSILSFNEESKEYEFDIVDAVIIQDLDKQWIELSFDDGSILKCTEDHPILTTTGWVEAKDLENYHILIVEY